MIKGYKFGNKNNWRRWVWNSICKKYKKPKKDAIIVYLAGIEDLDRKIAIEKGFKAHNLIAIDKNEEVIQKLRQKGALAIQGDVFQVLKGFSGTNCKIDILIVDLCGGVTNNVYKFAQHMTADINESIFNYDFMNDDSESDFESNTDHPHEPVVVFNFMRGRDKGIILDEFKNQTKHRGEMLMESMCKIRTEDYEKLAKKENRPLTHKEKLYLKEERENTLGYHAPNYNSYKSQHGNIVMDSVVFYSIPPELILNKKLSNEYTKKISATLAIRTMKINKQLKPCPDN